MDWAATIGANIRYLRKAKGLTQEQLAYEAGVAQRYLAGMERGEENPSLTYLVRVADALGVPSPGDLFARRRQA